MRLLYAAYARAEVEAEQEDAVLVQAELRSRRWQERSTGAALEEALYCTAQMDVAAHRAQGSARSASYTARQAALPAKASELPWQADGSAQAVEDALAEPVGSAAQREWERERASWAAERKALRRQAAAHDAELASLRDELRTSLQAAKEAGRSAEEEEVQSMRTELAEARGIVSNLRRELERLRAQALAREGLREHRSHEAAAAAAAAVEVRRDEEKAVDATEQRPVERKAQPEPRRRGAHGDRRRSQQSPTRRQAASVEPEPEPEPEPEQKPEPEAASLQLPLQELAHPNQLAEQRRHTHGKARRRTESVGVSTSYQPWALPSPRSLFRHRYLASIGAVQQRRYGPLLLCLGSLRLTLNSCRDSSRSGIACSACDSTKE
eukprot:COSAG04_NODE_691_length_11104_cov_6.949841_14_plen_381_part_00